MPFGDLSGQFISQSFQVLVQADTTQNPVTFADGLGNDIGIMTNAQTSSFLTSSPFTATAISGAFNGQTGSFLTELPSGLYSSSLQTLGNITASGDISASGTGSFAVVKATNIEGNSPLNIKGVSNLTFATPSEGVKFQNTDLFGNPIFHGDVNIVSQSAFLGENDEMIFRADNVASRLEIGGESLETRIDGSGINLVTSVTASSDISASGNLYGNLIYSDSAYYVGGDRVIYTLGSNIYLGDTDAGIPDKAAIIQGRNITLNAPVTASIISASGDITANSFIGTIDGGSF